MGAKVHARRWFFLGVEVLVLRRLSTRVWRGVWVLVDDVVYFLVEYVFRSRFFKQLVVSAFIVGMVFSVQSLPFSWARQVEKGVEYVLGHDYDFAGAARQLASGDLMEKGKSLPILGQWLQLQEGTFPGESWVGQGIEFQLPVLGGSITSAFGERQNITTGEKEFHQGIDIAAGLGTPVRAAAAGRVGQVQDSETYGLMVEIDHGGGFTTLYAHNLEVYVEPGDWVRQGEVIARVGQSGNATSPHLHFEIRKNGISLDPTPVLQSPKTTQ